MKNETTTAHHAAGYGSRADYLNALKRDYPDQAPGIMLAAEILGPNEDFDGLVSHLEDGDLI